MGSTALPVRAHLRSLEDLLSAIEGMASHFGRLDILVNSAGALVRENVPEASGSGWDETMDANLKAMFLASQYVVPFMREQDGGCILNIASAVRMEASNSPYTIPKWGTIGLTKGFAKQSGKDRIRVNAIAPGATSTAMMSFEEGAVMPTEATPLARHSTSEDTTRAAVFLASEEAVQITGAVLVVDGGQML